MKAIANLLIFIMITLLGSSCASVRPTPPVSKPVQEEWHYTKPIADEAYINNLLRLYNEVQQSHR